ncbi:alkaline phosphatase family protein [Roseisolibacter sp. H3M3-2]|uniref:alkaline phosphatase family protein n=1 Tax=Roseisolibacter sp. H3M3-2 TaxID=3031323 RepID=UPI0023DAAA75|nr:alkaline phosphatase family protein [Roseisolibacter sp. H3M3-2]MDF1502849.1 alkaline phosphatase family protein [Roseisolibacter sp. H3M3-2]
MPLPPALRLAADLVVPTLLSLAAAATPEAAGTRPAEARPADTRAARARQQGPTLVVLVVVDQMRADYLTRFAPQLTGGIGRLAREGAVLTRAVHDHAITETAPGHATLLAGRHPRSTGIIGNILGVDDPASPLVGADSGAGEPASPRRFRGTTLADWMVARDGRTQVLAVSRKDRGAILPVGRARARGGDRPTAQAYWYATNGRFTTSRWYGDRLPAWVESFNARALPQGLAGKAWTPLLPDSAYPEPRTVPAPNGRSAPFPHPLPADPAAAADYVRATPYMDDLTVDLALAGVRALKLGESARADLLVVSLSTVDAAGHQYGPDSRELHDAVLRADRAVGRLLDTLLAGRDPSRVVVALTSDHGVTRMPETAGGGARRVDPEAALAPVRRLLESRGVSPWAALLDNGALYLDRRALEARRVKEADVVAAAESALRAVPGVQRVDRVEALARADTARDAVARRWLHSLPPDYPIPLVATLDSGSVWSARVAAEHGTPTDDDARVPLVLWGAPFRPGRHDGPARTVDLAPTLARVLGVRPAEPLDGRVLGEVLR